MAEFRLGIQSYCFRKFLPLDELIGVLKEAGLSYVELWTKHLGHEHDKAEVEAGLARLKDEGITVDSCGVVRFTTDEAENRKVLDFARLAGIKAITADPDPDAYDLCGKLCDEYDINLAIHNHGRNHRYGHFSELKEAFSKSSPRIGLCADTAWFLDAGEDPVAAIDEFKDRLYGVHLKDFTFDDEGGHEDVILGTGGLDLPALMERLKAVDFSGVFSIEYEGDADAPLPAVKECVQVMNDAIAQVA